MTIYHQQAANLKSFDQNIGVIIGEKNNYPQIDNAYLQYELTILKNVANAADRLLVDGDVIRLLNKAFAYCFKEARLSTSGGSDIEHNSFCGQVTITMEF